MSNFMAFFKRGLGALIPTVLTIAVLTWAYQFVDNNIARHITSGVLELYALSGEPDEALGIDTEAALTYGDPVDQWDERTGRRLTAQYITLTATADPGIKGATTKLDREKRKAMWELVRRKWKIFNVVGFLVSFFVIYVIGYFLASFIGRTTWVLVERTLMRIPLIGTIYPNIKQVTDFFISDKKIGFAGVVAVQYPRKGIWSLGLMTGPPMGRIAQSDKRELITVFIPSSPTPVTGYTITVAKEDVIELPLTIDEALRYTISGGVVKPTHLPPTVDSPQ